MKMPPKCVAIKEAEGESLKRVTSLLATAKAMVVVCVLSQGRQSEETLDRIAPLWDWLFKHYHGLLHADGEGYYDANGAVLAVE